MNKYMNLSEAWKVFGFDLKLIVSEMKRKPSEKRPNALKNAFEKVRIQSRKLMAKHHPDRGGKFEDFNEIKQAIDSIEFYTQEYTNNPPEIKDSKVRIELNK
jgi:hypothetical protein